MHRKDFIRTMALGAVAVGWDRPLAAASVLALQQAKYDLAIIGGGTLGLATAYYAQQAGVASICIIDPALRHGQNALAVLSVKITAQQIALRNVHSATDQHTHMDAQLCRFINFLAAYRQGALHHIPRPCTPQASTALTPLHAISAYHFLLQNNYDSPVLHAFVDKHVSQMYACSYQHVSAWAMLYLLIERCALGPTAIPLLPGNWQAALGHSTIACIGAQVCHTQGNSIHLPTATLFATRIIHANCADTTARALPSALASGYSMADVHGARWPFVEDVLAAAREIVAAQDFEQ
jgi:hypothetical protein